MTTATRTQDFLVTFTVTIPDGTAESEVTDRKAAEARAASQLVSEGHLLRLWAAPAYPGETRIIGLYRAESESQLDEMIRALPLYPWMRVLVTPLEPHPNDPQS